MPSQLVGFRLVTWRDHREITIAVAGAPISTPLVEAIAQALPSARLVNMYGQAELGPRVAMRSELIDRFEPGNVGRPLPGVEVTIGPGDEILVTSPFAMVGYIQELCAGVRSEPRRDTRDAGHLTPAGELVIAGRLDNRVDIAGVLVNLEDIEATVSAQAGVVACRVKAVAGDRGRRPHVEVVLATGTDELSVREHVRTALRNKVCREAAHAADLRCRRDSLDRRRKGVPPVSEKHVLDLDHIVAWTARTIRRDLQRKGAVVAISGGIDSTVCLRLAIRALGPDRVTALYLPDAATSSGTSAYVGRATEGLADCRTIDISEILRAAGCDAQLDRVLSTLGEGWSTVTRDFALVLDSNFARRTGNLRYDVALSPFERPEYPNRADPTSRSRRRRHRCGKQLKATDSHASDLQRGRTDPASSGRNLERRRTRIWLRRPTRRRLG